IQHELSNALADINTLRSLLMLPPVNSIADALLDESNKISGRQKQLRIGQPTLESLPDEVLDQIAGLVNDKDSIMNLCHAVPYYKYISKAIYDVAKAIEDDVGEVEFDILWPFFHFPPFDTIRIPLKHRFKFFTYARVLQKNGCGADIKLYDIEYLDEFSALLPGVVSVYFHDDEFWSAPSNFESVLNLLKGISRIKSIPCFSLPDSLSLEDVEEHIIKILTELPLHSIRTNSVYVDSRLTASFKDIKLLRRAYFNSTGFITFEFLPNCNSLKSICFEDPSLRDSAFDSLLNWLPHSFLESVSFTAKSGPPDEGCFNKAKAYGEELRKIGWTVSEDLLDVVWKRISVTGE
ncbi:hypothetical protein HDU79_011029, partial [Rhizoclosmatium sp. JEL0117]